MSVKVGLVGLTHPHAPGHLRSLELIDDVEAVYLVEEDAAALAQARERPKVVGAFTDLDDLLRRDDVPVLMVLKRNDESVPFMRRAVAAGKHVISDKPAARTTDEFSRLLDEAARKNVLVSVFYMNRWRPDFQQMFRVRQEGALGRLMSVEARMITSSVALRDPRFWLFQKSAAGGGILHWLGCHFVDLIRYLSGLEVVKVSAAVGTLSGEAIDVEDVAVVWLTLSNGALATLHAGYMIPVGQAGYTGAPYDMYFGLRGTDGRTWIDPRPDELRVILESVAPDWNHAQLHTFSFTLPRSDAYGGVSGMEFLRAFFRAVQNGTRPPVSGEDALKVLQIVEAAYMSNATGRAISLYPNP